MILLSTVKLLSENRYFSKKHSMKKHQVLDTLNSLPDEFDAEQLIERIIFIDKVEQGLADAKEGRVISLDEARQRFQDK